MTGSPFQSRNANTVKIKVAHVATVDMSLYYLLLNQLQSIRCDGYEVIGISRGGPYVSELTRAGIPHIAVPFSRELSPFADMFTFWHLYHVMRRGGFVIVHTHTPKAGLLGQIAARFARVPIVVNTLHGFYFHDHMHPISRHFYILMEKIAARCSDVILSQNREDIKTALDEKICRPDQIKFLGNGIDLQRFDPHSLEPGALTQIRRELRLGAERPVVGFVGRLVSEKGVIEILRAAQMILKRRPDVQFLFVGPIDREKPDALTPSVAEEFGVASACIFAGLRHDMPELYSMMDVFVLPSHREGFPRSPMEASAMQVPCVVTDIRGCRETVEENRNGLLVPLGDVAALAQAILHLLSNPAIARRMGAIGREIAVARFDEELVFARVKSEYRRLLAEKGFMNNPPCNTFEQEPTAIA